MASALLLVAGVERASRLLRRIDREPAPLGVVGPIAARPGIGPSPVLGFERPSAHGIAPDGAPLRADLVLLGHPSGGLLRARSFYFDAGATVVSHGRLAIGRKCRLHIGADVLDRVHGRTPLTVPRILERGRRLRHAWLAEELVAGTGFDWDDWVAAGPELADAISSVWLAGPIGHEPIGSVLTQQHVDSLSALLEMGPPRPERRPLLARIGALVASDRTGLTGWCHGDPVRTNWLRPVAGGLGLVDWEMARWRPLAHDAMKLLVGLPDPLSFVDRLGDNVASAQRPSDAPWRVQVAALVVSWLATWPAELRLAERRGHHRGYHRRIEQRLDLLDLLVP